jgi:hypothetical protein
MGSECSDSHLSCPDEGLGNSLADFRSGRIAEKKALGFRGGAGQEFAEQVGDEALLELGGLGQAVEDAYVPGTLFTA